MRAISEILKREIKSGWDCVTIPKKDELFDRLYSIEEDCLMHSTQQSLLECFHGKSYIEIMEVYYDDVLLQYLSAKASAYYIGGFVLKFVNYLHYDLVRIKNSMFSVIVFTFLSDTAAIEKMCEFLNSHQANALVCVVNLYIDYGCDLFGASKSEVMKLGDSLTLLSNVRRITVC